MPHPYPAFPHCSPTYVASAALGMERIRTNLTCRLLSTLQVLLGSKELVKAPVIKIGPDDCLSVLRVKEVIPLPYETSHLEASKWCSRGMELNQCMAVEAEQRDPRGAGGGHWGVRGTKHPPRVAQHWDGLTWSPHRPALRWKSSSWRLSLCRSHSPSEENLAAAPSFPASPPWAALP